MEDCMTQYRIISQTGNTLATMQAASAAQALDSYCLTLSPTAAQSTRDSYRVEAVPLDMSIFTDDVAIEAQKSLDTALRILNMSDLQREVIHAVMHCRDYDRLMAGIEAVKTDGEYHEWSCTTAYATWRQPPAKHLMEDDMTYDINRRFADAIAVQTACNPSGIAHSLYEICAALNGTMSTHAISRDPAVQLFALKLADLCGIVTYTQAEIDRFQEIIKRCAAEMMTVNAAE
jgi:hypothetical protein